MDDSRPVDTESPAAVDLFEHRATVARDSTRKVYDILCPAWAREDGAASGGVFDTKMVVSPCIGGVAFALAEMVWDTAAPDATPEEAMAAVTATFTTALAKLAEERAPGRLLEAYNAGMTQ